MDYEGGVVVRANIQPIAAASTSTATDVFKNANGERKPIAPAAPTNLPPPSNTKIRTLLRNGTHFTYNQAFKECLNLRSRGGGSSTNSSSFTLSTSDSGAAMLHPTTGPTGSTVITTAAQLMYTHSAIGREVDHLGPDAAIGWFTDLGYRYAELLLTNSVQFVVDVANAHLAQFLDSLRGESAVPPLVYNGMLLTLVMSQNQKALTPEPTQVFKTKQPRVPTGKPLPTQSPTSPGERPSFRGDQAAAASEQCLKAAAGVPCYYKNCPFNHDRHAAVAPGP